MIVSEIKLFELLKAKIGEKEAEAFVEILETKVDHKFEEAKETLATKGDIGNVREEMATLRGSLEVKIAESKADLIKWMFIFWASQLVAIFTFLKFFSK
jgi:hypothetical protein